MTGPGPGDAVRQAGSKLLGPTALAAFAQGLADERPRDALLAGVTIPAALPAARTIYADAERGELPRRLAVAFLNGLVDGHAIGQKPGTVTDLVWGGPVAGRRTVERTGPTLIAVVDGAERELLLMTYSAAPHRPIIDALIRAALRGVAIRIVVETLSGAGGALTGREPATAFLAVPGVELLHWPVSRRGSAKAKQHAKLAVADRSVLFITSANLTASGVDENLEAGVLIRGEAIARECVDHLESLCAEGILNPIIIADS